MVNLKPNNGQTLKPSLIGFCSMLIEEARDLTGLSFEKLDEELDISNSRRIYLRQMSKNIDEIQILEGKVAKLLQRAEHKVVLHNQIEFDKSFSKSPLFSSIETSQLELGLNLRHYRKSDLEFVYALGWPTYGELKYHQDSVRVNIKLTEDFNNKQAVAYLHKHPMNDHWTNISLNYAWQWGVLWDEEQSRGKGLPWLTKQRFGIPEDKPVVDYLSDLAKEHNEMQSALNLARLTPLGKRLCDEWDDKNKILALFESEQQLSGLIFEFSVEQLEKKIKGEALYLRLRIDDKRSPDLLTLERQFYEKRILQFHKNFFEKEAGKVIIVNARTSILTSSPKVKVKFIKYGTEVSFEEVLTDVTHPNFKINDSQNFDSAFDMDYIRSLRNIRF